MTSTLTPLPRKQILVAAGACHIPDDDAGELAHGEERGAHIAGAECGVERCPAEILPAGVSDRRGFPVIIGVILLHERVVSLPYDLMRPVVDDHRTDGASAFVEALFGKVKRDTHKIAVAQFLEESLFDDRRKAARGNMGDCIQDIVSHVGVMLDQSTHAMSSGTIDFRRSGPATR